MEQIPQTPDQESVYGGSMNPYDFYQAEFEVSEEPPKWVMPDVEGIKGSINGEDIEFTRLNTRIYDMNEPYEHFSHVYVRREGQKPFWILRERGPSGMDPEAWDNFVNRLIEIDCQYICGLPEKVDFDMMYQYARGEEDIDSIIGRLLLDGSD